eukprot:SAG22_NODE_144_length_17700_cov_21.959207_11_plen_345_part_00
MKSSDLPTRAGTPRAESKPSAIYVAGITVLLAFLYAAQSIAVTNSKTNGVYLYDPNSSVMATEAMKLALASALFFRQLSASKHDPSVDAPRYAVTPNLILKFAFPALVYMLGNNMLYLALRYLDAPTYQILGNSKIVVVAVVQRVMLKSKKALLQWLGVSLLMLGMMVIASGKLADTHGNESASHNVYLGLLCMFLIALSSAIAGVYSEFLLKSMDYSTDFQNVLLYSWGVVFCVAGSFLNSSPGGGDGSFFGGFEAKVWLVVLIQAFLGQVVSRVMKYADNITKVRAPCGDSRLPLHSMPPVLDLAAATVALVPAPLLCDADDDERHLFLLVCLLRCSPARLV